MSLCGPKVSTRLGIDVKNIHQEEPPYTTSNILMRRLFLSIVDRLITCRFIFPGRVTARRCIPFNYQLDAVVRNELGGVGSFTIADKCNIHNLVHWRRVTGMWIF